jgi:uncharacterized short protein YbdD (DUF466 family)
LARLPAWTRRRAARKLLKGVEDLRTYVERNRQFIPNYGERYRNRERKASGFVESAVNQVVSKRMVKRQQMGSVNATGEHCPTSGNERYISGVKRIFPPDSPVVPVRSAGF